MVHVTVGYIVYYFYLRFDRGVVDIVVFILSTIDVLIYVVVILSTITV